MLRLRARLRATLRTRAGDAGDAFLASEWHRFLDCGQNRRVSMVLAASKTLANVIVRGLPRTLSTF